MKLTIREARAEDAAKMQRFFADLLHENLDVIFTRPQAPSVEILATLIEKLDSEPNSRYLLAYQDKELVGMLDLHGSQHPQKSHCAGFGMSVAAAFRGKGVGRALVESMLDFAQGTGLLARIELEVFETNDRAIRLYESMGFHHEGRRQKAVLLGSEYIDVLCMALLLNSTNGNNHAA